MDEYIIEKLDSDSICLIIEYLRALKTTNYEFPYYNHYSYDYERELRKNFNGTDDEFLKAKKLCSSY